MAWLNIAAFVPCTESEGPGLRAALWVQGCAKRCPGCCNPSYLALVEREIVSSEVVAARIADAHQAFGLEGVTFLGGEPMLQARGLAEVASACKARGLSVMTFTGYTMQELAAVAPDGAADLLASTDVLVDGEYVAAQLEHLRNWVGSSNQRFHYLSDRYSPCIETDPAGRRSVEVQVGLDGRVRVNGWPTWLGTARSSTGTATTENPQLSARTSSGTIDISPALRNATAPSTGGSDLVKRPSQALGSTVATTQKLSQEENDG